MNDTPVISETANQPTSNLPANPPVGTIQGMGLCCACPASSIVSRSSNNKYYWSSVGDYGLVNNCNIDITRTTTGGKVKIKKKCVFAYANGATPSQHYSVITGALASAMKAWTDAARQFKIQITQPGCEIQVLDIVFVYKEVANNHRLIDLTVTADNKTPATLADGKKEDLRSSAIGGTNLLLYLQDTTVNWTMIHELGHAFGLPDEYTTNRPTNTKPTIIYFGADNPDETITLAASRSIKPDAPGLFAFNKPTIMGRTNNTTYEMYMFYWIAIEVKQILAKLGVTADVRVISTNHPNFPGRSATPTTTN